MTEQNIEEPEYPSATTHAGAWVDVDGVKKRAIPYVRDDGVWKEAQLWTKFEGFWEAC